MYDTSHIYWLGANVTEQLVLTLSYSCAWSVYPTLSVQDSGDDLDLFNKRKNDDKWAQNTWDRMCGHSCSGHKRHLCYQCIWLAAVNIMLTYSAVLFHVCVSQRLLSSTLNSGTVWVLLTLSCSIVCLIMFFFWRSLFPQLFSSIKPKCQYLTWPLFTSKCLVIQALILIPFHWKYIHRGWHAIFQLLWQ